MDNTVIFVLQFLMSLTVYALIAQWFIKPWLSKKPKHEALILLILPNAFRHIGLVFLATGVVAYPLPDVFANPAAYGDLITALLAILSMIALRKSWAMAIPLIWIFNIVGSLDLLNALYQGVRMGVLSSLGASWYLPTFIVPALLVTHFMIFVRLLEKQKAKKQKRKKK